ncbi:MAG: hypothetical protein IKM17_00540 [Lentisphaeria bacterium]|nr:hypothetical protein [Lentisphaeria bacterium]
MSDEKLPCLDRIATFYDLAQTTTGAANPEWHLYSMTEGKPEQVLDYFPELQLPAVVFSVEKIEFGNLPPIDLKFYVMICVDATDENVEEKLNSYRRRIGEILLTQAVMNPSLSPESCKTIMIDPMIRAELLQFSLRGY